MNMIGEQYCTMVLCYVYDIVSMGARGYDGHGKPTVIKSSDQCDTGHATEPPRFLG